MNDRSPPNRYTVHRAPRAARRRRARAHAPTSAMNGGPITITRLLVFSPTSTVYLNATNTTTAGPFGWNRRRQHELDFEPERYTFPRATCRRERTVNPWRFRVEVCERPTPRPVRPPRRVVDARLERWPALLRGFTARA